MSTLKFALWNAEWMNELFANNPIRYHDSDKKGYMTKQNIADRIHDIAGVVNEVSADIWVLVEGPNQTEELQYFFDTSVNGAWYCAVQSSGAQSIGIAVRADSNLLAENPLTWHNLKTAEYASKLDIATNEFRMDTDNDAVMEVHKFERKPLYASVKTKNDKTLNIIAVHLKSKGIFNAMEWSKWWSKADGNRKKIVAQCHQLRIAFLDDYLTNDETKNIPLIVCGDINDGPGFDTSEMKISASGVERLMGSIWKPNLTLGNVMYDVLNEKKKAKLDFEELYTASFADPIFNNKYQKAWIDHILYSRAKDGWIGQGEIIETMADGEKIYKKYPKSSDHFPVTCLIDIDKL